MNIPKGKYTAFRRMMLIVNILTVICMLAAMGTGIYLSQSIFAPLLGMREAYLVRPFHVAAGAWGTIMVSVHAGMHIRLPEQIDGKERKIPVAAACAAVAVLGVWSFILLDMPLRLAFQDTGMYWSYPGATLFLANAVLMVLFAGISAAAAALLRGRKNK